MKLTLIQDEIDAGSLDRTRGQKRCPTCPLALMFTRAVGEPCAVGVFSVWRVSKWSRFVDLPPKMQTAVGRFDSGCQLVPQTFDFPDESWAKLIGGAV